ncbi:MAG: hypothetical protein JNM81_13070 [Rhodospirillaceae bacterium]|nr:hypothetical protein [Rhodospirillaceae bacterium]
MKAIIPLAGPDFVHPTHGIKPLWDVDGEPLIKRAITSRPWWQKGLLTPEHMVFVLRRCPEAEIVSQKLDDWFPGSQRVWLSHLTGGALLSAMAGTALMGSDDAPLCIDLVDLLYDCAETIVPRFADKTVGGVVPWFTSTESCYSYFELNADGRVARAVEKQVISNIASAGTYFFRNTGTFLTAAAHSLKNPKAAAHKGVLFVCPAMNGVIAQGLTVDVAPVTNVRPISKLFH